MSRKISYAMKARALRMLEAGSSRAAVSAELGISATSVRKIISLSCEDPGLRTASAHAERRLKRLIQLRVLILAGLTATELTRNYGYSYDTVRNHAREWNLTVSRVRHPNRALRCAHQFGRDLACTVCGELHQAAVVFKNFGPLSGPAVGSASGDARAAQ